MDRKTHIIDAEGKKIGRLASEVAFLLQGKHKTTYTPHIDGGDFVEIVNVDKLSIDQKKLEQKEYHRHSQYPGGLKTTKLKTIVADNPAKVIQMAVSKMLPKNKLRSDRMKRLTFKN